jgi:hypothetical protein
MIRIVRSSASQVLRFVPTVGGTRPNLEAHSTSTRRRRLRLHRLISTTTTSTFVFEEPFLFPTNTCTTRRISSTSYHPQSTAFFSRWAGPGERQFRDFLQESSTPEKEAWLESLLDSSYKHVDAETFLIVLNALALDVKDPGAARRAEQWMKRLKDHRIAEPTAECYQAVIQAWANSSQERIQVLVNRAKRWLDELIAESEKNPDGEIKIKIQPTIECYNAFLDACTRGRSGSNKKNQDIVKENAQKADAILRRLNSQAHHHNGPDYPLTPNTDSFNFVIRGWTRCQSDDLSTEKAMALLRKMESYQRDDPINSKVRPNTKSYSMAMNALVSMAGRKARLCTSRGNFVVDPKLNGLKEMTDAQAILQYMHDLHDAGVEGVIPHTVPYNIILTGYANLSKSRHNNAPLKAEDFLRKMFSHKDNGFVDAAPDRLSFEKVRIYGGGFF